MRGRCEKRQSTLGLGSRTEWKEMTKGIWKEKDWLWGDKREICVLFHYSPWSRNILGGSPRDGRAFLFFLFFSWILFFPCGFLQTSCCIAPSLSLPPFFYPPFSLVSTLRWKLEMIITRPFAFKSKGTTEPGVLWSSCMWLDKLDDNYMDSQKHVLYKWHVGSPWHFQTLCSPLRAHAVRKKKRHRPRGTDPWLCFNCARAWRRPTKISDIRKFEIHLILITDAPSGAVKRSSLPPRPCTLHGKQRLPMLKFSPTLTWVVRLKNQVRNRLTLYSVCPS